METNGQSPIVEPNFMVLSGSEGRFDYQPFYARARVPPHKPQLVNRTH